MQLDVLNIEGKKTGRSVTLSDEIFGIEPNDHLIYMAVKHYLAGKHRGTHKTKGRSEVQGSTRKLHRQKGTGGSRKGNIRNPLYHGGGTIFGPKPHSYGFKMNRKEKDLAKISALAYKASGEAIRVVEGFDLETPKTKTVEAALKSLEVSGRKILYVTASYEENVFLSFRNLPRVKSTVLSDINTYDIMNSNYLVLTEEAAKILADEEAQTEEVPQKEKPAKKTAAKAEAKPADKKEAKKTAAKTKADPAPKAENKADKAGDKDKKEETE